MFKDIFVYILQSRNITAYKLSKDTGITQGMISYWKNGERMPSADNLITLADYFDCSVDYLLGRTVIQRSTDKECFYPDVNVTGLDTTAYVRYNVHIIVWS